APCSCAPIRLLNEPAAPLRRPSQGPTALVTRLGHARLLPPTGAGPAFWGRRPAINARRDAHHPPKGSTERRLGLVTHSLGDLAHAQRLAAEEHGRAAHPPSTQVCERRLADEHGKSSRQRGAR